ncbi:NAD-glutamate dehydrogenase [Consotaella salsifontis]|uniref:Glutamate dehydrogenase n=1 Tax=Consotaella salsifontis TaxID=1365950 RepID=A0A1T4T4X3_9HYPH|nr:NAD-glutamate dehydrogenase [Consotaella salsifontis]SKA35545.1 glutamate dehydrogenase [Consotaella salsifontis]
MDQPSDAKAAIVAAVLSQIGGIEPQASLAPLLFDRPPAADLASFSTEALAAAVDCAVAALKAHRPGEPVVAVVSPGIATVDGRPLQLISVVNDDMSFLFDSVTGEIAEAANAVHFVSHPILNVERGPNGAIVHFTTSSASDGLEEPRGRVSLIQVAVEPLDSQEARALADRLRLILSQVALANADFPAMRSRVARAVDDLRAYRHVITDPAARTAIEESAEFLDWLYKDAFIFLGCREYDYVGSEDEALLERRENEPGLGILQDPDVRILRREDGTAALTTPEVRAFLEAPEPLIVTKANARSLVHRRAQLDYIGVKRFSSDGRLAGELRIVGLFASSAYTQSILAIPYLRLKAKRVIERFGLRPGSHSGKALLNALESYPRDEMFQIDVDLLEHHAGIILELGERPRVRVLTRVDRFHRFVSVIVYVPRERYDTRLRERVGLLLAEAYDGHLSSYSPAFPGEVLARIHYIVEREEGETPDVDPAFLEEETAKIAHNWIDDFREALIEADEFHRLAPFGPGLPESYRDLTTPADAVVDVMEIAKLTEERPLTVDFYRREGDPDTFLRFKLYHLGDTLALSARVPILERMGFQVLYERTHRVTRPDGSIVHIHDMDLSTDKPEMAERGPGPLEDTFSAVWDGRIENDGFNALVLCADLAFDQVNVLRAYSAYLRQTGLSYSPGYMATVFSRHPGIARLLFELFDQSFDPEKASRAEQPAATAPVSSDPEERYAIEAEARGLGALYGRLAAALDAVEGLDDDRILRRVRSAILSTLRTNFYAVPEISADPSSTPSKVHPALAFKIDPHALGGLPAPVPYREIFVFDARVEGVHLRFGSIARGGLRWSDRAQDYRTEILGLVKAQQVKNAVIVPVGAKGGFYPKRLPDAANREAWFEAGRSAYIVFIASLLSVTDNIDGDHVVTPQKVVRLDGEDPYFVVAADKGTATFSDTANAIARSRDFWLDDAFASGGSAGYDHKAMGITARGAWEAVKRHFRELGRDIQKEPFTVAGCGDMSGDVFGNGMLLSPETKLVAAFDHRDIFIDPDPDPALSLEERRRLFALPRSSWADYAKDKLSKGGGIWSRREKLIKLTPEAAEAIGWDRRQGTPAEVISAILKAPVDLLWFGGIGTYVRASSETNSDVGDRANDAVRVTGADLRAKVVGEGANLGVTQKGRIEFARAGGRINSDAIDNSAGVNTSDVEVNIKIALKSAMASGKLTREARNQLLSQMTDEVAHLVLRNNYEQTLAISLEEAEGDKALPLQARFMSVLEDQHILDRDVEALPPRAELADLRAFGRTLTRPEIGVLLAYAKIVLFDQLVASDLPDEPYFHDRLHDYFPTAMRSDYPAEIDTHRLSREIVATVLANQAINRLGPTFVVGVGDATGAAPAEALRAFAAAKDGLFVRPLYDRIDALDGQMDGAVQNALYREVRAFLHVATRWFVQNCRFEDGLASEVARLRETFEALRPRLQDLASDEARDAVAARTNHWVEQGVPADVAEDVALLPLIALIPDIGAVSRETGASLDRTLGAYFDLTGLFEIGRLEQAAWSLSPSDYYETLALERAGSQIARARRALTASALREHPDAERPAAAWISDHAAPADRIIRQIAALVGGGDISVARLTVAAGLLSDLAA